MRKMVGQLMHLGQDVLHNSRLRSSASTDRDGRHQPDYLMHYVSRCSAVLPATCAEIHRLYKGAQGCQHQTYAGSNSRAS